MKIEIVWAKNPFYQCEAENCNEFADYHFPIDNEDNEQDLLSYVCLKHCGVAVQKIFAIHKQGVKKWQNKKKKQ
jgi:uncharacterized protein YuzB (UPF0349 family)